MSGGLKSLNAISNILNFMDNNNNKSSSTEQLKPSLNKNKNMNVNVKVQTDPHVIDYASIMPPRVERKQEYEEDIHAGGNKPLKVVDAEVYSIIKEEEHRQSFGLELIASENFTSRAVMEAVGTCLTNKYSEGLPNKRYYGGNQVIDKLESLCIQRALAVFGLDDNEWSVNVQPYSGSTANFAAFTAMLAPGERFMGLHLPDGGHLSHGYYRGHKAVNISAKYFQSLPYHVDANTGWIDHDDLERTAKRFYPKLIVAGSSAYPRDWDYERFRAICDSVGAKLMVDMAHYSGMVAAGIMNSPFPYADIVTTTTHKSMRATRAALIFCRKEYTKQMNSAVFPGCQGGPHNHAIAGVAVALKEAQSVAFKAYARQTVKNCQLLAQELMKLKYTIATGGTDCHLLLWDVRPQGITGSKLEYICDLVAITINKNTVHGDKSAMTPGGVRVGTPALTTRGFLEKDMIQVAGFLHEACEYAIEIQKHCQSRKMKVFKPAANEYPGIADLKARVEEFSSAFPMPGIILD